LGSGVAAATAEACRAAKNAGLTVSCHLNYRKKLWTPAEAQATKKTPKKFGIRAEGADVSGGQIAGAGYAQVARTLAERFGLSSATLILRESRSTDHQGRRILICE
jgi:2-dehydro-3-deoxygluconokinase